jgi:phospholipid methyltransferase
VVGPYRYVRNPLYNLDAGIILGTALLCSNWWLAILTVVYVCQLRMHPYFEERELKARFGETYDRYCRLVPRFIPRRSVWGASTRWVWRAGYGIPILERLDPSRARRALSLFTKLPRGRLLGNSTDPRSGLLGFFAPSR